jgi:tetratricopeptide (TPR) repeat protein
MKINILNMRKLSILLVLIMCSITIFAQKRELQNAIADLRRGKLDKALVASDLTVQNQTTKSMAKTWYYRGHIFIEIGITKDEKYAGLDQKPMQHAFEAYTKAIELDEDQEFTSEITQNMGFIAQQFYNNAALGYNNKDYAASARDFKKSYDVYKTIGVVDTTALLNYAISCDYKSSLDTTDQSIQFQNDALAAYQELMAMEYFVPTMFSSMANIYREREKYDKAEEIVGKGRQLFPNDNPLVLAEINLYMTTGQDDKAINSLIEASVQDSTNHTIWFALANQYDKMSSDTLLSKEDRQIYFDKAKETYFKVIEVNENHFESYLNLGAMFVNSAAEIQQVANDLPLNAVDEYNELKAQADALLAEALPFLEKAMEINPHERDTIISLKEIYSRLGKLEKAKEMNQKL